MAILLWIAGFLAIIAGMPQLAIATWTVIVINGLFSFFQEYRADKALEELAKMLPNKVKVYCNGEVVMLLAEEITVGDLIVLETGNRVPADAKIIEAVGLSLDNSLLTGESVPVDRNEAEFNLGGKNITESSNMIFAGTTVTGGSGRAVVYAVGSRTEIGKVSKLTQNIKKGESTLEIQVQKIVKLITAVSFILGVLAFATAVFGLGLDLKVGFIFAIGIIVANIPEGLLPTLSMSLAIGVQRTAKQNALIRRLSAVETLSAASVICTDKTGTITENQLTVKTIWTPNSAIAFEGLGYEKAGKYELINGTDHNSIEMLLVVASICSEANIVENKSNAEMWDISGSPTEAALLIAVTKYGIDIDL
jgi:P-type E1-E2 ATPase